MFNLLRSFTAEQTERILADAWQEFQVAHPEVTEGTQLKMVLYAIAHTREIALAVLESVFEKVNTKKDSSTVIETSKR